MELLSPAGSYESLCAAVKNGADAVYLGAPSFNARKGAKNLTIEEIPQGIRFCRENGVRAYAVLNTLVSDREMTDALKTAEMFAQAGIDAFIVQDIGLAAELKKRTNIRLHASTQLSAHNLDGVLFLQNAGFSRVVLAREMSARDIETVTRGASVETEVFVHGALCMCYSGQCYMSAVIGGRSGNRGQCAQPCRLPCEHGYELSLKDNCLLKYVGELEKSGVTSLKIEGRMKSPDYVAGVTRIYADAVRGKPYSVADEERLAAIFSRDGFTDGYYTGKTGRDMFGTRTYSTLTSLPEEDFYKRVGLDVTVKAYGETANISFVTDDGFEAEDSVSCSEAQKIPTDENALKSAFSRLGGTPYKINSVTLQTDGDKFIPSSLLNPLRRGLLEKIADMRLVNTNYFKNIEYSTEKKTQKTAITDAVYMKPDSVGENAELLSEIWLPLTECKTDSFAKALEKYGDRVGVFPPRIIHDSASAKIRSLVTLARDMGVKKALIGNLGHIAMFDGFEIFGDFGLNVFNSSSVEELKRLGFFGCTLSFELNSAQLRDLSDGFCRVPVYGRLPLMITRNCIRADCKKQYFLRDRMHEDFLVTCEYGCANQIWNSRYLYLADLRPLDIGAQRLIFTDETREYTDKIISAYTTEKTVENSDIIAFSESTMTRGLFNRRV